MIIIDGISRSAQVGYIVIYAKLLVFMGTISWFQGLVYLSILEMR